MWYGVALLFCMSAFLGLLAWLNHRHFDTFFDLMDGRLERMIGAKGRRGGTAHQMQRHLNTIVLSIFSLTFLWYFVKSLGLVFGMGS